MSAQGVCRTAAANSCTVLLVEDDALVRMATAEDLRRAGLQVIEAASAEEAFGAVRAGLAVDVVFTDVRTEGALDGYELARQLKAEHPDLPVILTSGHMEASVAALVAPFLAKPYRIESVIQLIRTQMAGRAAS